jgi:hypothetical protein
MRVLKLLAPRSREATEIAFPTPAVDANLNQWDSTP